MNTVEKVTALAQPICDELELFLWDVRFEKEGATWYLKVLIDKDGGVTMEDCENFTRPFNKILDEADPIKQNYYLEVSSPGMDRPLLKDKDFERFMGSEIEIKLYKAMDGKKFYTGKLTGYGNGTVTITDEKGKEISLQRSDAAKINLAVVF